VRLFRRTPVRIPEPIGAERPSARHAVEFAWHVHTAQESWANKADVKASILLALEGGALLAVISAHAKDGVLSRLAGWHHLLELSGLTLLLLALLVAVIAVFPGLGRTKTHRKYRHHIIFFGNLRHWSTNELKTHLDGLTIDEELDALSWQLIEIGRRNWRKHRWIQISLVLAFLGILCTSIAAITLF
jgi:Family of unknown function (DUF5706)